MSNLSVRGLGIRLGGRSIIEGLDLEVAQGEFLVLLGPSGCGKSTLLHAIAGLVEVDAGSVHIGGSDMTSAEPNERGIGMVFQSYALYPAMTVAKNMSFGLRVAGTPKAEVARRVGEVARMLQLDALLERKPAQLSGGQRQRVAIGRALVREASVLLFDEPLSNLDAQLRTELRRELKTLHQRLGATMVYVTHDQVEAMTLATRIVVMRDGRIQQVGTPAEVYRQPANQFVAGFLGAPPINFVEGSIASDGRFRGGPFDMAVSARAGDAVLGIRPEHLRLDAQGELSGEVTQLEPMGNHQVAWVRAASQSLAILAAPDLPLTTGQAVRFTFDASAALLFDRDSGVRL